MRRLLDQLSFKKNRYARPNQNWICGHADEGHPCPLGPDERGRCRSRSDRTNQARRSQKFWTNRFNRSTAFETSSVRSKRVSEAIPGVVERLAGKLLLAREVPVNASFSSPVASMRWRGRRPHTPLWLKFGAALRMISSRVRSPLRLSALPPHETCGRLAPVACHQI